MSRQIILSSLLVACLALTSSVSSAQAQAPAAPQAAQPTAQTPAPAPAPADPGQPIDPSATLASSLVSPRVLDPTLNDTLRVIRSRGTLRACVALFAPWVISDGQQKLTGYAVDITNQVAEDLNVDAEFVLSAIPDMIDRLHRGECDLIPGGFAPTPQRALFAHFTTPTTVHDVSLVGRRASLATWGKADAPGSPEATIGVIEGTADADLVRRRFPKAKLEPFSELADLVKALADGKVAVAVVSSPLTEFVVQTVGEQFTKAQEPAGTHRDGLAVRRGDLEFLAYLNTWVQARTDDRWIPTLAGKWFTARDWTKQP